MLLHQVGVVAEVSHIGMSELMKVAAALQKQASRDFAPIWGVKATVNAFQKLDDVPVGYWPVIVMDNIQQSGAGGVHLDRNGQPYALVQYDDAWSLTASHETLEMLADPFGSRLQASQSLKAGQGRVEYLVEVCDPCEAPGYAYSVNGVTVSDFYTPHFFDPVKSPGVRYSYTGAVTEPREVLPGGYISWHEPVSDTWWQLLYFNDKKTFRKLDMAGRHEGSLRSAVDALTRRPDSSTGRGRSSGALRELAVRASSDDATSAKAEMWRREIRKLLGRRRRAAT
ncbi:MAG: hypothetical protein ACHQU1_10105 [Gemmatimonadales bacterium]